MNTVARGIYVRYVGEQFQVQLWNGILCFLTDIDNNAEEAMERFVHAAERVPIVANHSSLFFRRYLKLG